MKVAVVTPYYREADALLENCLASVRGQTWPQCTHFLVADGVPNPLVAAAGVRHITLPSPHGGGGNLARCIGAMTAAAEGFDAIAFLDADNWYRPQHVERLVELQARTGASVCTSARSIHRLDGSVMDVPDGSDGNEFADTNCLCIFRGGFDLLPFWGQIPPSLGLVGDRVFWSAIKLRMASCAHSPEPTVCYRSSYLSHYQTLGETPPPDAKRPEPYFEAFERFVGLPLVERTSFLYGVTAGEDPVPPVERVTARVRTITVGTADRRLAVELPDNERSRFTAEDIFGRACYAHPAGAAAPKAILDIGAGVGLSAAYFRLAFPEAALHCVEPDVLAYDCLVRNATVIGNCTTYRAALYNMACSSRIHFDGSGAGSLAPISGRPARIFLLDAATFMDEMPVAAFDLVKLDAGGVEVPILLRIREKLSRTAVVHVKYYGQLQRRLIDDLLVDSHELWREMTASPTVGRLAYVRR